MTCRLPWPEPTGSLAVTDFMFGFSGAETENVAVIDSVWNWNMMWQSGLEKGFTGGNWGSTKHNKDRTTVSLVCSEQSHQLVLYKNKK